MASVHNLLNSSFYVDPIGFDFTDLATFTPLALCTALHVRGVAAEVTEHRHLLVSRLTSTLEKLDINNWFANDSLLFSGVVRNYAPNTTVAHLLQKCNLLGRNVVRNSLSKDQLVQLLVDHMEEHWRIVAPTAEVGGPLPPPPAVPVAGVQGEGTLGPVAAPVAGGGLLFSASTAKISCNEIFGNHLITTGYGYDSELSTSTADGRTIHSSLAITVVAQLVVGSVVVATVLPPPISADQVAADMLYVFALALVSPTSFVFNFVTSFNAPGRAPTAFPDRVTLLRGTFTKLATLRGQLLTDALAAASVPLPEPPSTDPAGFKKFEDPMTRKFVFTNDKPKLVAHLASSILLRRLAEESVYGALLFPHPHSIEFLPAYTHGQVCVHGNKWLNVFSSSSGSPPSGHSGTQYYRAVASLPAFRLDRFTDLFTRGWAVGPAMIFSYSGVTLADFLSTPLLGHDSGADKMNLQMALLNLSYYLACFLGMSYASVAEPLRASLQTGKFMQVVFEAPYLAWEINYKLYDFFDFVRTTVTTTTNSLGTQKEVLALLGTYFDRCIEGVSQDRQQYFYRTRPDLEPVPASPPTPSTAAPLPPTPGLGLAAPLQVAVSAPPSQPAPCVFYLLGKLGTKTKKGPTFQCVRGVGCRMEHPSLPARIMKTDMRPLVARLDCSLPLRSALVKAVASLP